MVRTKQLRTKLILSCFVNLVRTKRRLSHSQRLHSCLLRCFGRVRPASAHSAHDTMLSDAKASRSQELASSRVRREQTASIRKPHEWYLLSRVDLRPASPHDGRHQSYSPRTGRVVAVLGGGYVGIRLRTPRIQTAAHGAKAERIR